MRFKKSVIFILIPMLAMLLILSLHWFYASDAKDLISSFFEDMKGTTSTAYENYIHPHFEGDLSLVEFLSSNIHSVEYKILSSRRVNMREYRVSVELGYNNSIIPVHFMVLKDNGKWLISHMPEYAYIPAALFIEHVSDSEKHNLKFDIK